MNRNYIIQLLTIFFLYFICAGNISGQETGLVTVSSVIQDDNGNGLPNAKISGKEGATVVWSDVDGKFTISVPAGTDLLIEKKGCFAQLIPAAQISKSVTLTKAPFLMSDDDVVNIAFGKIKKKEVAGIVNDVINPEEKLTINSINNWDQALEGRNFVRTLRNPLIIIDGLPRMPTGLLAEEIEQINVLKGVNAAVLYGTQARDGVILIKTKRGEAHKRRINFALEHGFDQSVILPKYLGSAQYMELYNEALVNDGESPLYEADMIDNYRTGNQYRYPDVDYYSGEFLRASRPVTRFNGEFSGGNKNTRYYTNLGLINTGSLYNLGTGKDASTNELNMRANADLKINNFIEGYFDATANFVFNKQPNGNFWNAAANYHPYYYSPVIPLSMLSEGVALSLEEAAAKYINSKYILGGTSQYQNNVYGNMYLAGYNQHVGRLLTVTSGLDFDLGNILEGLTFKTLFGADMYNAFSQSVNNSYAVYNPKWSVSGDDIVTGLTKIGEDASPGIQNVSSPYFYRQITAQTIMDYNRSFDEQHSLNVTALGYYTKLRRDFFAIDDKAAHLGLRVAYDFDKRFFANFSSAYVHSIKLKNGNRNAFSPTIGLGWVISEEDFLTNVGAIDFLKLKFSAGILNTDYTEDTYERFTDMSTSGYDMMYKRYQSNIGGDTSFGWADGSYSNSSRVIIGVDNPGLTFEKVKDFNLGIEGYFFDKSLAIDVNAFYIKNSGIIVQLTDTYSSMLSSYIPYENYEANSYTGVEVGINWMKNLGDFSFDIGANLIYRASNADKRDEIYPNDFQYREGNPVWAIFGLESDGFFDDANEINSSPVQTAFGMVSPGDIKYKDQDNDGYITENDVVYLGNWMAPLAYGLNLTLRYKNFSLYTLCDGQNGGNSTMSGNYYWVDGFDKYSEVVLDRWTEATKATATYPRLTAKSSNNNFRVSDFWLYDNSFFRVNRVQLTYEFPRSSFGLKGLSIYLRGSNLLWVGKNVDKMQLRIGTQPSYRQYAAGLRISF